MAKATPKDADLVRSILWRLERSAPDLLPRDPVAREALETAAKAPADWLDRLTPESHADRLAAAGRALTGARKLRRAVATLERVALAKCNGVPVGYDSARREPIMGLTDEISAQLDRDGAKAAERALAGLREILADGFDRAQVATGGDPRGLVFSIYRPGEVDSGDPVFSL